MEFQYLKQSMCLLESLVEAQKIKLSEAILREKMTRDLFCNFGEQNAILHWKSGLNCVQINHNDAQEKKNFAKLSLKMKNDKTTEKNLNIIKITQNNEKKSMLCTMCDYRAKWRSELIRHQKVHQKKRPYKCKFCYWTGKWKNGLVRHIICVHKISADEAENAIQKEEPILIE